MGDSKASGEPGATPARTREHADQGVKRCIELMTEGRWVTGKSHQEIAAEFMVSPATVKDWATSASRIIRLATEGDREDIRARMLATLDTVVSMAMTKQSVAFSRNGSEVTSELYPNPDLKAAVAAIAEQAKLLGLVVQKHDVTTRPSVAHLSREEHEKALEQLEREIAAERARLAQESGDP